MREVVRKGSFMRQQPRARSEQIVVQDLSGELLIYDLESHKATCLNQTAAGVWKACEGELTPDEIAQKLSVEWGKEIGVELVWLTLEKLSKAGLLVEKVNMPVPFGEIPRREMMRRLRVASIVAAPLIASILAPKALASASSRPSGAACIDGAQCTSRVCLNGICA